VIIFGSVRFLSKKVTKPKFFFFEKKTETGSNRPVSIRFSSVFREKTGSNRFGSVFFWFFFCFSSVRFFRFFAYKTETEPADFFKILIGFFFSSVFSVIVFSVFSV